MGHGQAMGSSWTLWVGYGWLMGGLWVGHGPDRQVMGKSLTLWAGHRQVTGRSWTSYGQVSDPIGGSWVGYCNGFEITFISEKHVVCCLQIIWWENRKSQRRSWNAAIPHGEDMIQAGCD